MARQPIQGGPTPRLAGQAEALVTRLGLSSEQAPRAAACVERLASGLTGGPPDTTLPATAEEVFRKAIEAWGFRRAANLVERCEPRALVQRAAWLRHLASPLTPFYPVAELATHIDSFIGFLRTHRDFIVKTGLPPQFFRDCRWLYARLGRLYDTRMTDSPYPVDELTGDVSLAEPGDMTTGSRGGPAHDPPYRWLRRERFAPWLDPHEPRGTLAGVRPPIPLAPKAVDDWYHLLELTRPWPPQRFSESNYGDASLHPWLSAAAADRIERDRERLLELKIGVLRVLGAAAHREDGRGVWDDCLELLRGRLNADDIEFYLGIDQSVSGSDVRHADAADLRPRLTTGGLTDLLVVVGHFEAELTIGWLDRASRLLDDDGAQHALDEVLDALEAQRAEVGRFWDDYRDRVREAFQAEFRVRVSVEVSPQYAKFLHELLQHQADQLQLKLARGEMVAPMPERNVFRRDGGSWTIQYAGKLIAKPDTVGLWYINQILRHAGRELSASELHALRARWAGGRADVQGGEDREVILASGRAGEDDAPDALRAPAGNLGEMVDDDTRNAFKKAATKLAAQAKTAEEKGDQATATRLRKELCQVEARLKEVEGLGGRIRDEKPADKLANDAVRNAVNRALKDLAEAHPALAAHLRPYLGNGSPFHYRPQPVIDWEL